MCTNVNARRLGLGIQEVFFEPVRALVKFGQPLFDAAVVGAAVQESRLAYSPALPTQEALAVDPLQLPEHPLALVALLAACVGQVVAIPAAEVGAVQIELADTAGNPGRLSSSNDWISGQRCTTAAGVHAGVA